MPQYAEEEATMSQRQEKGMQTVIKNEKYKASYQKLVALLEQANIDYRLILPTPANDTSDNKTYKSLCTTEIVRLQEFLMKKLAAQ